MDILNNINWYIATDPDSAINKSTQQEITREELDTVVFDDSLNENVKFVLPLNDNFKFTLTRELPRPITVEQILSLIMNFYEEPLEKKYHEKAFEDMEDWMEEVIDSYEGNINKITKYDVFTDTCTPDFCGLQLDEKTGEYFVSIGPE